MSQTSSTIAPNKKEHNKAPRFGNVQMQMQKTVHVWK